MLLLLSATICEHVAFGFYDYAEDLEVRFNRSFTLIFFLFIRNINIVTVICSPA